MKRVKGIHSLFRLLRLPWLLSKLLRLRFQLLALLLRGLQFKLQRHLLLVLHAQVRPRYTKSCFADRRLITELNSD